MHSATLVDVKLSRPGAQGFRIVSERGSASQTNVPTPHFPQNPPVVDPGVRIAAAVDSLVQSVRLEIEEDLATLETGMPLPDDTSIDAALEVAREIALKFHRQLRIDVAGFVAEDGRVAVLAHSMETGRRTTFYVDGSNIRAIRTSVSGKPVWLDTTVQQVPVILDWITRID